MWIGQDPLSWFFENCPLDRHRAESMARELGRFGYNHQVGSIRLTDRHICSIPDVDTVIQLWELMKGMGPVLELGAGIGLFKRTLMALDEKASKQLMSIDLSQDAVDMSDGVVKCLDNMLAIKILQPRCLFCSWPAPNMNLLDSFDDLHGYGVERIVAVGPWLRAVRKVGPLVTNPMPDGWQATCIESVKPVDVFSSRHSSFVYLIEKEG